MKILSYSILPDIPVLPEIGSDANPVVQPKLAPPAGSQGGAPATGIPAEPYFDGQIGPQAAVAKGMRGRIATGFSWVVLVLAVIGLTQLLRRSR